MALIQCLAVVDTPLSHAEQRLHQQRLWHKLGTCEEAGQVGSTGGTGDGWPVGIMNSFQQQVNQACCTAIILQTKSATLAYSNRKDQAATCTLYSGK